MNSIHKQYQKVTLQEIPQWQIIYLGGICESASSGPFLREPIPASALSKKPARLNSTCRLRVEMARGRGFEPRLEAPKAPVLPLDDPRNRGCTADKFNVSILPDYGAVAYQKIL